MLKTIAWNTAIVFTWTQLALAAPSNSFFSQKRPDHRANQQQQLDFLQGKRQLQSGRVGSDPGTSRGLTPSAVAKAFQLDHLADLTDLHLPEEYGRITEVYDPSGITPDDRKLIIHIQDLHTHPEAQRNLVGILQYLRQHHDLPVVCVEGAGGRLQTELLASFPVPAVRAQVAEQFLEAGELTGEEYLALTTDTALPIEGVEDADTYFPNLVSFHEVMAEQAGSQLLVDQLTRALAALKPQLWDQPLLDLDTQRAAYETGTLSPSDYLTVLSAAADQIRLDLEADYPEVQRLHRLLTWEAELDQTQAQQQTTQLLSGLSRATQHDPSSRSQLEPVLVAATALEQGRISSKTFYTRCTAVADALEPAWRSTYPQVATFSAYLQEAAQLDSAVLYHQLRQLYTELQHHLAPSEAAWQLGQALDRVTFLEGFINLRVSNDELDAYLTHRDDYTLTHFRQFLEAHRGPDTPYVDYNPQFLDDRLPVLEAFYALVKARDESMVANTLRVLETYHADRTVLIAGGFHTPGVTQRLKAQGYSYVVVAPHAESELDYERYHALLGGVSTPLPQLVAPLVPVGGLRLLSGFNDPSPASSFMAPGRRQIDKLAAKSKYRRGAPAARRQFGRATALIASIATALLIVGLYTLTNAEMDVDPLVTWSQHAEWLGHVDVEAIDGDTQQFMVQIGDQVVTIDRVHNTIVFGADRVVATLPETLHEAETSGEGPTPTLAAAVLPVGFPVGVGALQQEAEYSHSHVLASEQLLDTTLRDAITERLLIMVPHLVAQRTLPALLWAEPRSTLAPPVVSLEDLSRVAQNATNDRALWVIDSETIYPFTAYIDGHPPLVVDHRYRDLPPTTQTTLLSLHLVERWVQQLLAEQQTFTPTEQRVGALLAQAVVIQRLAATPLGHPIEQGDLFALDILEPPGRYRHVWTVLAGLAVDAPNADTTRQLARLLKIPDLTLETVTRVWDAVDEWVGTEPLDSQELLNGFPAEAPHPATRMARSDTLPVRPDTLVHQDVAYTPTPGEGIFRHNVATQDPLPPLTIETFGDTGALVYPDTTLEVDDGVLTITSPGHPTRRYDTAQDQPVGERASGWWRSIDWAEQGSFIIMGGLGALLLLFLLVMDIIQVINPSMVEPLMDPSTIEAPELTDDMYQPVDPSDLDWSSPRHSQLLEIVDWMDVPAAFADPDPQLFQQMIDNMQLNDYGPLYQPATGSLPVLQGYSPDDLAWHNWTSTYGRFKQLELIELFRPDLINTPAVHAELVSYVTDLSLRNALESTDSLTEFRELFFQIVQLSPTLEDSERWYQVVREIIDGIYGAYTPLDPALVQELLGGVQGSVPVETVAPMAAADAVPPQMSMTSVLPAVGALGRQGAITRALQHMETASGSVPTDAATMPLHQLVQTVTAGVAVTNSTAHTQAYAALSQAQAAFSESPAGQAGTVGAQPLAVVLPPTVWAFFAITAKSVVETREALQQQGVQFYVGFTTPTQYQFLLTELGLPADALVHLDDLESAHTILLASGKDSTLSDEGRLTLALGNASDQSADLDLALLHLRTHILRARTAGVLIIEVLQGIHLNAGITLSEDLHNTLLTYRDRMGAV